jgi:hypothetical protein
MKSGDGADARHLRTLLMMVAGGTSIFVLGFMAFHLALVFGGHAPDRSVLDFYPLMAGIGALFGFERWWSYEQGGVNPFHD